MGANLEIKRALGLLLADVIAKADDVLWDIGTLLTTNNAGNGTPAVSMRHERHHRVVFLSLFQNKLKPYLT